jgi:catechol 2,3-dioxygenase-like lactoylglutathione lyase family enzyme
MTALAFGFTKLVTNDLETSERFYCDVFGMKRVHRVSSDAHQYALDESILTLSGASDGHALVITQYRRRPGPPPGALWTGFTVPDIEQTLRELEWAGGRIEVPVHENSEPRVKAAIAADPDGHLIEIIQLVAAE